MDKFDKKANYLASCLLESIEDKNIRDSKVLLDIGANPNTIIIGKEFASLHYAVGVEPIEFANEITKLLLSYGGNPNIRSDEHLTPVHIAAIWNRPVIIKMLLEQGGDINLLDDENKTAMDYAIYESNFDVILTIQKFIFEKKTTNEIIDFNVNSPIPTNTITETVKNNLQITSLNSSRLTPNNRINYNFDVTSPYYINITHRKKDKNLTNQLLQIQNSNTAVVKEEISNNNDLITEDETQLEEIDDFITNSKSNLFELTKDNLVQFQTILKENSNCFSLIEQWRKKVSIQRHRKSILSYFNDVDEFLNDFNNTFNYEPEEVSINLKQTDNNCDDDDGDSSFITAKDKLNDTENFIKSPKTTTYILQMTENYVHTDDDGMVFYEKKNLPNPTISNTNIDVNQSQSSISTVFTIPLDYDTDLLRAELTGFGESPGPITKSTKRLYLKKLIKFKRNPDQIISRKNGKNPTFSVEIERTLRDRNWIEILPEVFNLEKQMTDYFKNSVQSRRWREGHLKTSFVYLLIDPTISENLPGQYQLMSPEEVWTKFLSSIFYVGKGKKSRPYSHLYDAMKFFLQTNGTNNLSINKNEELIIPHNVEETIIYQSSKKESVPTQKKVLSSRSMIQKSLIPSIVKKSGLKQQDNKKLDRIINVWKSQKGVVCLHVFHNIIPAEAYTREASIIDCLGLQHLTNLKRGDYYGVSQSWTMKTRKNLGIGLLYRALQIFLAEGESQLMPCDLI